GAGVARNDGFLAHGDSSVRQSITRSRSLHVKPQAVISYEASTHPGTLRPSIFPSTEVLRCCIQVPHTDLHIVSSSRQPPVIFLLHAAPTVPEWLRLFA